MNIQIPEAAECAYCGKERTTVRTTDGDPVCRSCIEDIPAEKRPEGYKYDDG